MRTKERATYSDTERPRTRLSNGVMFIVVECRAVGITSCFHALSDSNLSHLNKKKNAPKGYKQ